MVLIAAILAISGLQFSCQSSSETMYPRKRSSKSQTVKSNIKVKGTNKANSHTTRSY
ncbi:MAG: hypothetical protein J6X59_02050 [Bacteroidales bacterium]|nr:hypothetical protein [Bacteroidales bacterium]